MGNAIFTGTVQPAATAAKNSGNKHGMVNISAKASGTGAWQATFRLAPVYDSNQIGEDIALVVTNVKPLVEDARVTTMSAWIGWWTVDSGSVTLASLVGEVQG